MVVRFCGLLLFFASIVGGGSGGPQSPVPPSESPAEEEALLAELPVVEAAALHTQTLHEAPANVTLITAADIRKYGFRTLGEALQSVRGFYLVNDTYYRYAGLRGLNVPGDYNTRFLVMINGHPMTEAVYASNGFFGQDFGLDLDLVERIEIIHGPTSALYGSNGMLTNINIVTRSPVDSDRFRASTETDTLGGRKAIVSAAVHLGRGANLLVSGSVFHNRGQAYYIPEYDSPETRFGRTSPRSDQERGYHSFANLLWGNWNLLAYFNDRQKFSPVPWSLEALFDDPETYVLDQRNFVGGAWSRDTTSGGKLRWQIYFDQYRYRDYTRFHEGGEITAYAEHARAEWLSSQLSYRRPVARLRGALTVGAAATWEIRNRQNPWQVWPERREVLRVDAPDRLHALFLQHELELSRRWTLVTGLRLDSSRLYSSALSPRAALIFAQSEDTTWKLVYGRPFRNPSPFEQFWYDGVSYAPSGGLKAERAHAFELSAEHRFSSKLRGMANLFHYSLSDLIQAVFEDELIRYRNFAAIRSRGLEGELAGELPGRFEFTASFIWQAAHERATGWMVNSPRLIAKARLAVPLAGGSWTLAYNSWFLGARRTMAGELVNRAYVGDFTLASHRLHPHFDVIVGVRNVFDHVWHDPVAVAVDRIRGPGRHVFVKFITRVEE